MSRAEDSYKIQRIASALRLISPSTELAGVLTEISNEIAAYLILPEYGACTTSLWCAHTWALEAATYSPILAYMSPERGCAKTRALTIIGELAKDCLPSSNISAAAIYRLLNTKDVTLLIDEVDSFFTRRDDGIRNVLNSGFQRDMAFTYRCEGDKHEPKAFRTWGAKAIAGIGGLPETTASRSIIIRIKRRLPHERIEKLRGNRLAGLGTRLGSLITAQLEELRAIDPAIPEELGDREGQAWTPLLAIAELAGGPWPELARTAAVALSKHVDRPASYGERLLADIRKILDGKDAISTSNLAFHLGEMEEQPWPTIRNGKEINGHVLAGMLKEYGIKPDQVWIDGKNHRGYERAWFEDAWSRYLTL